MFFIPCGEIVCGRGWRAGGMAESDVWRRRKINVEQEKFCALAKLIGRDRESIERFSISTQIRNGKELHQRRRRRRRNYNDHPTHV